MLLKEDIELIEGLPIAYIKSINALVISDLHLGYESAMIKNGIFLPQTNLKSIIKLLTKALADKKVSSIIIVGDIKNEFSKVEIGELNELRAFLAFLKQKAVSLTLIKGNHDNFIESYSTHLGIKVYHDSASVADYLFVHGDKKIQEESLNDKIKLVILGHEHPSIGIPTKVGIIERVRCFLYGDCKHGKYKIKTLILPAIGYFETGSDVNLRSRDRAGNSILRDIDVNKMNIYAVGYGSTMDFGKLGRLKTLANQM